MVIATHNVAYRRGRGTYILPIQIKAAEPIIAARATRMGLI